jgi:hypothetical protein
MCSVLITRGVNPVAVHKYIISYHIISCHVTDMFKEWWRGDCQRSTGMATIREKETRLTQTYRAEGIRGMMGEKGLQEEDWSDRNNWGRKIA